MIIFKYLFWLCYRIWFYILVTVPIIIMFPLLLVFILKESWYPLFFKSARLWSWFILIGMGFIPKITKDQNTSKTESYMFVPNHTSMLDIMLMFVATKNPFVFVAKAELGKIPLFGFFCKRTCIMVDRSSPESRKKAFLTAQNRLKQGISMCIFPEGMVPEESVLLTDFKSGAFRLAINHQISIVPVTFGDNKKRFSYTFFSGSPGKMRVRMHEFIETKGLTVADSPALSKKTRDIIYNQLVAYGSK